MVYGLVNLTAQNLILTAVLKVYFQGSYPPSVHVNAVMALMALTVNNMQKGKIKMAKCIIIENCSQCSHRSHQGAFGKPRYVPSCSKIGSTLPYEGVNENGSANATEVIPTWCPLTDFPNANQFIDNSQIVIADLLKDLSR